MPWVRWSRELNCLLKVRLYLTSNLAKPQNWIWGTSCRSRLLHVALGRLKDDSQVGQVCVFFAEFHYLTLIDALSRILPPQTHLHGAFMPQGAIYWVADNTHCGPCGFTFTDVMKLSEESEGPFGYDYKSYVRSFANTLHPPTRGLASRDMMQITHNIICNEPCTSISAQRVLHVR